MPSSVNADDAVTEPAAGTSANKDVNLTEAEDVVKAGDPGCKKSSSMFDKSDVTYPSSSVDLLTSRERNNGVDDNDDDDGAAESCVLEEVPRSRSKLALRADTEVPFPVEPRVVPVAEEANVEDVQAEDVAAAVTRAMLSPGGGGAAEAPGLMGLEEAVAKASRGGSDRNPKCKSSLRKSDCALAMDAKSRDEPFESSMEDDAVCIEDV
jgi:hypothetical protein